MRSAQQVLDAYFPEMRWRALSLAADLDRIQRAGGATDPRLEKLREAFKILIGDNSRSNRAEQVQMIFSDTTPPVRGGENRRG
jgi:hypothetical protein